MPRLENEWDEETRLEIVNHSRKTRIRSYALFRRVFSFVHVDATRVFLYLAVIFTSRDFVFHPL